MKGYLTIGLLILSNIFMTLAWYGHLKFKELKWFEKLRWFLTSDGFLVVGGRDANTNETIVKKYLDNNFDKKVTFRNASGGVNFFGSLPKDYSSIDLRYYLESIGINILEGTLFYYNIKSENEFRISIAHMLEKDIEKNLDKLNIGIRDFLNDEKNKMKYKIPNI